MAKPMTTDELKKTIANLSAVKQRRRYDAALRAEVIRYARRAHGAGQSWRAICEDLDLGEPTLARFLDEAPGFAEVKIAAAEVSAPKAGFTVRGPAGLVVEGLSLLELADLVRRVSCSV